MSKETNDCLYTVSRDDVIEHGEKALDVFKARYADLLAKDKACDKEVREKTGQTGCRTMMPWEPGVMLYGVSDSAERLNRILHFARLASGPIALKEGDMALVFGSPNPFWMTPTIP